MGVKLALSNKAENIIIIMFAGLILMLTFLREYNPNTKGEVVNFRISDNYIIKTELGEKSEFELDQKNNPISI